MGSRWAKAASESPALKSKTVFTTDWISCQRSLAIIPIVIFPAFLYLDGSKSLHLVIIVKFMRPSTDPDEILIRVHTDGVDRMEI